MMSDMASVIEVCLLRERVLEQAERLDALTAERDAIQAAWNRDKALADEAIDHHMARWKQAEAERDALRARAERAESERDALQAAIQAAWDSSRAALAAASEVKS